MNVGTFTPRPLTGAEQQLRAEVRDFLSKELPHGSYRPGLGMGAPPDPGFSRKLGTRGWLGMAIPREYGGHDRSAVERFVVVEELLAVGAPVGAHWIADRQSALLILTFGTEEQKRRFLPRIAAGECYFSIGMSEPDSGSDLAAVRSSARRVDGGWSLTGRKVWTSGAHHSEFIIVLCRTSPLGEDRHEGLSQMIVGLDAPGVSVNPIEYLNGHHSFNEVVFDEVFVPDELVVGEVGAGWRQVTSELAYERSGPDRYLSSYSLFEEFVRMQVDDDSEVSDLVAETIGRVAARFWGLRQLSISVAGALDEGAAPALESAIVKDLGTTTEQWVIEVLRSAAEMEPRPDGETQFEQLLAEAILTGPSFTIRGGTTEILRTIIAKGARS